MESIDKERSNQVVDVEIMCNSLEHMHKDIDARSQSRRTHMQRIQNVKTKALSLSIDIRDYVIIRTHSKRDNKRQF